MKILGNYQLSSESHPTGSIYKVGTDLYWILFGNKGFDEYAQALANALATNETLFEVETDNIMNSEIRAPHRPYFPKETMNLVADFHEDQTGKSVGGDFDLIVWSNTHNTELLHNKFVEPLSGGLYYGFSINDDIRFRSKDDSKIIKPPDGSIVRFNNKEYKHRTPPYLLAPEYDEVYNKRWFVRFWIRKETKTNGG